MTTGDLEDKLRKLILHNDANATRIWRDHAATARLEGASLVPLYRCFSPRAGAHRSFHQLTAPLLLIGINPSAPCHGLGDWTDELFKWDHGEPPPNKKRIGHLKGYELSAEAGHGHFDPYQDLSVELGHPGEWAHLDMFLVRETDQKKLATRLYEGRRRARQLRPFFAEQFEQFKWTLRSHRPRVVVILNRLASNLALRELGLRSQESPDQGYPLYRWDEMPRTPFVLGSMLRGRGRMPSDKYGVLIESIRQALNDGALGDKP